VPSDKEIRDRAQKYGPFIRTALLGPDTKRQKFVEDQKIEIFNDLNKIRNLILSETLLFESDTKMINGFSHRLARFVVDRDASAPFGGYGLRKFECCTETVISLIRQQIHKLESKDWKECLGKYNTGIISHGLFSRTCFEDLFAHYATSPGGLNWKRRELLTGDASVATPNTKWHSYDVYFPKLVKDVTKFVDMDDDALYVPGDSTFPFVDMYYKGQDGDLIGIQVTTAKKHAKKISVYADFCKNLGIRSNNNIVLHMHYVMLPSHSRDFDQEKFPVSMFWDSVKARVPPTNVRFFVILPPTDFGASYPK
jgi:hypothetical protein